MKSLPFVRSMLITALGGGVLWAMTSCASIGDGEPFDKVITKETDLARTGANNSVTERHLEAGVRVRITGMSGEGKLEIVTISGDKGYVDRDSVGDAPEAGVNNQNGN